MIDPINEKKISMGEGANRIILQSEMINKVMALLSKDRSFMKKVLGINVILTKCDKICDNINHDVIKKALDSQGYTEDLEKLDRVCEQFNINMRYGFHVPISPFCIGKFMPGKVYAFDDTDSLKLIRIISAKGIYPGRRCSCCAARYKKKSVFESLLWKWFHITPYDTSSWWNS